MLANGHNMLLENKKVAIIGGGPGGLTLARLLQLKGIAVKVYERDVNEEARVQGATLDLHFASGLKAIKAAGLMDAFKSTYRPGAERTRVIDKFGNIIDDDHDTAPVDDFDSEYARPEIDRGPLRDLLLASLQPETVVWDSQFVSMSQVGGGWQLTFRNGSIAAADIVIGADGANSKIRPFITATQPFFAGTVILQGNVPDAVVGVPAVHQLLQDGKIHVFSDEKYLHISSKGDGSIDFYLSFKTDEHWRQNNGTDLSDSDELRTWFKQEFPAWDQIWLSLIENAGLPLLVRPQYCMPLEKGWDTIANVTLLGDAAHIMPPSGEGVNLAMLDALELSECLTSRDFDDIKTAIGVYEKVMIARGLESCEGAMEMKEMMHALDAQERFVAAFCQR